MQSSTSNFYNTYKTPSFLPQEGYASQSTFYTSQRGQSQTTTTPRASSVHYQAATPYQSSYLSSATKLQDTKQRYEKQVQNVGKKYEQHYTTHFELGSTVIEMEDLLELERRKVYALEEKVNDTLKSMEQMKRHKLDLERENRVLREKSRTNDTFITDYGVKMNNVQQTASSVNSENDSLRGEIKRLNDTYNVKLREIEENYKLETSKYTEEVETLKSLLKDQEVDTETKVRGITRELEAKIRGFENQIREKDRIIVEYNSEFKSTKDFQMKLKMECEDELKKRVGAIKDSERAKYEPIIKGLEGKLQEVTTEKELVEKKIPELEQEIKLKENKAKEVKSALEEQIRSLRKEILDLEDQICLSRSEIEKMQVEFRARDQIINRAQAEIVNLGNENQRQKDIYIQEIDRLAARNETDQGRFQEFERQYRERLVELERQLKTSEGENVRMRNDFDKLVQKVTGNINTTISQTFVAYGVQGAENVEFY